MKTKSVKPEMSAKSRVQAVPSRMPWQAMAKGKESSPAPAAAMKRLRALERGVAVEAGETMASVWAVPRGEERRAPQRSEERALLVEEGESDTDRRLYVYG